MADIITEPEVDPVLVQALNGVPQFYDLPDELREEIEKRTMGAERMFWLRANLIDDTAVTRALLRRAFYAEQRCWEMENRLAETSLIAQGLKGEVERLDKALDDAVRATS